jgi:myo-inositol-1(or 4)-monophosphatase
MRTRTDRSDVPHAEPLLALAVDVATRAAQIHDEGQRTMLHVEEKGSPFNLVTEIDRAAERAIVEGIVAARQNDGIVGEEGSQREGTSDVRWVIDPLDGTANYVYGYPAHAVSIGVEIAGAPSVGAVFDTARHIVYSGIRDGRATADGRPIVVSRQADLPTAMLATGFSFDPALRRRQGEALARLLPRVRDVRRSGAASIDLCAVATGAVDAYYEAGLAPWDLAGGIVIAEAAGATVIRGTAAGYPGVGVVAATPKVFPPLLALLEEVGFRLEDVDR